MLFRHMVLVIQQKADYNTKTDETEKKISDHENCFTTQDPNKLKSESIDARLAQVNLAGKKRFDE